MGEMLVVLPFVLLAASFVVVPFLGWGMADPAGQWERVQSWRGREDALPAGMATRHSVVNGAALFAWLVLLAWLFRTAG